jgi:adenylate kinase family enzyme
MYKMQQVTTDEQGNELSYYMEDRLGGYCQKIKETINKKDKDFVILVDGYEGSGKSTFAQQVGKAIDSDLSLDRICMTPEQFKEAIKRADKGQCVIYDEAVTGLSSGDAISKVGKILKSMMMQMRQKNLCVIVIMPTFFELNRYAVLSRAKALFHIYERQGRRGYFVGYNRQDMKRMYLKGKKMHSYCVRSFFTGRFYGKYTVDQEAYRKKKEEALFEVEIQEEDNKWAMRNFLIATLYQVLKKYKKMNREELIPILEQGGIRMTGSNISRIVGKVQEKGIIVNL